MTNISSFVIILLSFVLVLPSTSVIGLLTTVCTKAFHLRLLKKQGPMMLDELRGGLTEFA